MSPERCIFLVTLVISSFWVHGQDQSMVDSLNEQLILASDSGDSTKVLSLLGKGAKVNSVTYEGVSSLMYASQNGDFPVMRALIKYGAEPDLKPENGITALLAAIDNLRPDVAEFLIRNGADVNLSDNRGMTPLMHAIVADSFVIGDMLLYYDANVNLKRTDGADALMLAAQYGRTGIAEELISMYSDVNDKDKSGRTPLHYAAFSGNEKIIRLLIDAGADMEIRTNDGLTPLSVAVQNNRYGASKMLIAAGANVNTLINNSLNPLMLAKENHNDSLALMLKNSGAHIIRWPDFNRYTLGGRFNFSSDDKFVGVLYGLSDEKYHLWVSLAYDIRAGYTRVLESTQGNTYFQYWELRHMLSTSVEKAFIARSSNKINTFGFVAGLTLGASFASYQGTGNYPRPVGIISPGIGLVYQHKAYRFRVDYRYMDLQLQKMSPHWFGITTELVVDRKRNLTSRHTQ
jgi:ankyrin repeat protein